MTMWGTETVEKLLNPMDMLTADHERVERLFEDFDRSGPFMKKAIALQLCREVDLHATLEEEIFYPAVREQLGVDSAELVARSVRDHDRIKGLIQKIERSVTSAATKAFADRMRALRQAIQEHVKVEQDRLFPMAEATVNVHELAAAMDIRRLQLMARKPTPRALAFLSGGVLVLGLGLLLMRPRRAY